MTDDLDTSSTTLTGLLDAGLRLLENGDHKAAVAAFSSGVRRIRDSLPSELDCHPNKISREEDERIAAHVEFVGNYREKRLQFPLTNDSTSSFVIQSPMGFAIGDDNWRGYSTLSFVFVYNIALCNHLCALVPGATSRRAKICKAQALYNLAYDLQAKEQLQFPQIVTMALINNLGHCYEILQQHELSRQCYQHLLSAIMISNVCRHDGSDDSPRPRHCIDGFMRNIVRLVEKPAIMAAAA
jgi:hypothetical protein